MRIWDIHPKHLCRKHLLAEHRELHGLWNILTKHKGRGGYSRHPETLRWVGKQKALYERHEALVLEFKKRGYEHHTPLEKSLAVGQGGQKVFLNTAAEQKVILRDKPCECFQDRQMKNTITNNLQTIPGVGRNIAQDLRRIGIHAVADLKGRDPEELYERSNRLAGIKQDRCLLYVFREAVYFAAGGRKPEKLKWWNWKDKK